MKSRFPCTTTSVRWGWPGPVYQVVQRLVVDYPFARKIHLVTDNLNIHCRKSLTDHLGDKEGRYLWSRLKVHYTPKHGSWLNQAEFVGTILAVTELPRTDHLTFLTSRKVRIRPSDDLQLATGLARVREFHENVL